MMLRVNCVRWLICAATLLWPSATAHAQETRPCVLVCTPELKVEPTFTVENLGRRPRTEVDGKIERLDRETVFEVIFALDVPTTIPRVGFTLEAIFVPGGGTERNPFTGVAASELRRAEIRDNPVEIEAEFNFHFLNEVRTRGWVSSHFDIVDKFSPAEEPRATSIYSHKLNFELDTAFHIFNWLPDGHWLRNIEAEVSLDFVATGLPKAGQGVGGERFVDDANPWSTSFVFVFPLAPLAP